MADNDARQEWLSHEAAEKHRIALAGQLKVSFNELLDHARGSTDPKCSAAVAKYDVYAKEVKAFGGRT